MKHSLVKWFIPVIENSYSPKFLNSRVLFYVVILILVTRIAFVAVSLNFPKNVFFADVSSSELIRMVNDQRKLLGLNELGENTKLENAALLKAKDMLENEYFAHQSPSGITPWFWFKKIGYNYKYAGENLAIGFADSVDVYNAWFESDSHRENFLNPNYSEMGTAVLSGDFGGNMVTIVVQLFGKQKVLPIATQTKPAENKKIIEEISVGTIKGPQVKAETVTKIDEKASQDQFQKAVLSGNDSQLYLKILNTLYYGFDGILQKFIYSLFVIVGLLSVVNIVVNYNFQNRQLVFKSFAMVLLLCLGVFADNQNIRELIINLKI